MLRRKKAPTQPPVRKKKPKNLAPDKEKLTKIIKNLSENWTAEERETSVLYDHHDKVVHLETTYPATARRWFSNLWGDPEVRWDTRACSLKLTVPWDYCRRADLVLKAKFRQFGK